jgi:hypothetical protein
MLQATIVLLFENLFARASLMTLVLLVRIDVIITEDGTKERLNTGALAICCIDINPS